MSLINLINQHASAAAESGDWATVASTLNALTTEVKDNTLRTARWLMKQLKDPVSVVDGVTLTEADIVLGTLQAATIPRVKAAYDSLVGDGLDLSDEQIQSETPSLATAGNWPSGLAAKVMQAGRRSVAVITTTAAECEAAWNQSKADTAFSTVSNEIIQPALSDSNRTKESIATALESAAAAMRA